jgi:hypothetical protein
MISKEHRKIIRVIYIGLKNMDVTWAITGSLGFVLHGMDVPVNDIDLQTDQKGAYQIENAFSSSVTKNVEFSEGETIRSYFGELNILGQKVEIMGALEKKLPSGVWESPVDVNKYCEFVRFQGMKLPVLSLEYEERAYRTLGRIEKADKIKEWLTKVSSRSKKK